MASAKSLLLVGVLLTVVYLISSEVASSEVQQTKNGVEDATYEHHHDHSGHEGGHEGHDGHGGRGGHCKFGCCRRFRHKHGCKRCCSHATEAPDAFFVDDGKN
ncbi:Glycine rich protein [Dillenia turbinata]|uniref:Glycine rich protein n=1 Tax=Dillenia turbinata TaxID=194707 RepID=A0AAN8UPG9_9MAGN